MENERQSTEVFFQDWLGRALTLNEVLKIDQQKLFDAIPIIRSALGDDWLCTRLNERSLVRYLTIVSHPLAHWIKVPSLEHVCSVVELANYFVALNKVPGFDDVLIMIKDGNQFDSGFFQLAMAFRFQQIGGENLILEPKVFGGRKSDIQVDYCGRTFICECYSPDLSADKHYEELVRQISVVIGDQMQRLKKRLSLFADFTKIESVTQEKMARIKKVIVAEIETLQKENKNIEIENCQFEIYDTTDLSTDDESKLSGSLGERGDSALVLSMVDKGDLKHINKHGRVGGTLVGRIMFKNPPGKSVMTLIKDIVKKVDKKAAQTKSENADTLGMFAISSPLARPDNLFVNDNHRRELLEILKKRPRIAGVFFAGRLEAPTKRTIYSGYLMSRPEDDLMKNMREQLHAVEINEKHLK